LKKSSSAHSSAAPQAGVDPEAAAAELGPPLVVDQPEPRAQLHVVEGLVREVRLAAPGVHDLVGFLAADRRTVIGQVRQFAQQAVQHAVRLGPAGLQCGDLIAQLGGRLLRGDCVLARCPELADLLRLPVALGAGRFDIAHEPAAERVGFQYGRKVHVVHALEQGGPDELRVRPDQFNVKHRP
jgi:hypothetical protein